MKDSNSSNLYKDIDEKADKDNTELIESLQDELAELKDKRREDLFLFIVTVIVLLNILFFDDMGIAAFAILILELIIIIPLAYRMGAEEIILLMVSFAERISRKN